MGILNDLRSRVAAVENGLQTGELVRGSLLPRSGDIMELQLRQLFEGKASSGEDIRPYYSEDLKPSGYFHSVESAGRYSAWKKDGIRYPYSARRNPDAPNLYINGRFHSELGVDFGPDAVGVVPMTAYAAGIVDKYGLSTFGLTDGNWSEVFTARGAFSELMNKIKEILYVN